MIDRNRMVLLAESAGYTATLFHGTDVEFKKFDSKFMGSSTDEGLLGRGVYFSTDPNVARSSKFVVKAKVRLARPLRVSMTTWGSNKSELVSDALGLSSVKKGRALTAAARRQGYDSVILDYSSLGYSHQEVVVFSTKATRILNVKPFVRS